MCADNRSFVVACGGPAVWAPRALRAQNPYTADRAGPGAGQARSPAAWLEEAGVGLAYSGEMLEPNCLVPLLAGESVGFKTLSILRALVAFTNTP